MRYFQEERIACLQVLRHIGTVKALEVSKTYLNQVLSKSELLELGKLYQQFTKKDLIEIGIPTAIKNYIETLCKTTVTLHNEMINVLRLLKAEELKCTLFIKSLEIIEYDDNTFANKTNMFKNVTSLVLEGNFEDLSILNCMKNLTELSLYNLNDKFLIYKLNEYSVIFDLENFSLVTFAQEYITGRDLQFLTKCQSLEIILLNNLSEMYFEQFDELCNIRDLTIGAEFALELDYSCLPETIENLTIVFPKKEVCNNQYRDYIYSDIKNIYFEDLEKYTETYTWWSE